ncbi:hypothetical protein Tdes44962_MAKER04043 [Teratosphaeria destructans]|uniref:Uncharacterized protein n=1 Tax=Teratosphaeria destructans TaxID=418781 RepID=A0A9W7SN12_9PEZI|nr:hypothetical protein Tdes44962_MAKER04043 [Teratosphaeria destructans]
MRQNPRKHFPLAGWQGSEGLAATWWACAQAEASETSLPCKLRPLPAVIGRAGLVQLVGES